MPPGRELAYPTADHIHKGPPDPAKDPARARDEKWARVIGVIPTPRDSDKGPRWELSTKGPIAIPMAIRRKGTDKGSKDAWIFFTHPHAIFHPDAVYFNASRATGTLEARLCERVAEGFRLYDEVGAGFAAERVTSSYAAALGVFRTRIFAKGFEGPYARELVRFEIDLLECFRLLTLCLQTKSPINVINELDLLLKASVNLRYFTAAMFDEPDRQIIRQLGQAKRGGTLSEGTSRFRVDEDHFMKTAELRDGNGRQLVLDLMKEWQAFEQEHGQKVEQLGVEIARCEREARKLALEVEREKDEEAEENRVTRFLTGRGKVIKKLEHERSVHVAKEKELRAEFDAIPGYEHVKGLSAQIEGFKKIVEGVRRLATNIFDHNVSQQQVKSLEEIHGKLERPDAAVWKNYDVRLRADVFPRLVMANAISAYVLRRPDALPGGQSVKNVRRINRMALDAIDYFREAKLGDKTLGQVYDETWGQIELLESRL